MTKRIKKNYAIGVFDSGLGGLTVVKQLMKRLPYEDIVYFGDTARVPYGTKSKDSIIRFSYENTRILLKHKVKMIVVACNSSSSYALDGLKKDFDLPIVGVIEPGVKKAVEATRNKRIGVIATSATIKSDEYAKTIRRYQRGTKVFSQVCPLFVPVAEEGWFKKKITMMIAEEYLKTLKRKRIDTLILGCTHYPLLKGVIQKVMGSKVILIDSAQEVAAETKMILRAIKMDRCLPRKTKHQFLISDKPQEFKKIARNFLGCSIPQVRKVT